MINATVLFQGPLSLQLSLSRGVLSGQGYRRRATPMVSTLLLNGGTIEVHDYRTKEDSVANVCIYEQVGVPVIELQDLAIGDTIVGALRELRSRETPVPTVNYRNIPWHYAIQPQGGPITLVFLVVILSSSTIASPGNLCGFEEPVGRSRDVVISLSRTVIDG